jgi:hypothetical protein
MTKQQTADDGYDSSDWDLTGHSRPSCSVNVDERGAFLIAQSGADAIRQTASTTLAAAYSAAASECPTGLRHFC